MDSHRSRYRQLEGRAVNVALTGGSRIDSATLVSAGGHTLWIFSEGGDQFLPVENVIDLWEAAAA